MGFGVLDSKLRAKYQSYFEQWMFNLKAALPVVLSRAAEPNSLSTSDELRRLADLHAEGALDDEEFRAAKTKLLS